MLRPELRLADGLIFSFDATNRTSFENMVKWLNKAEDSAGEFVGRVIVANKMGHENSAVERIEVRDLAMKYSCKYYEMS